VFIIYKNNELDVIVENLYIITDQWIRFEISFLNFKYKNGDIVPLAKTAYTQFCTRILRTIH